MRVPDERRKNCSVKNATSDWVLGMISSFRHLVGLSCDGYEKKADSSFCGSSKTPSRSGGKFLRELKGLKSSVNKA